MTKVLECLRLQKQFHSRQIDLIIVRREQHEKCLAIQSAVEELGSAFRANLEDSRQVQMELYKSMDNAEKVVEVLEQKTVGAAATSRPEASEFLSKLFDDLKLMNQQSMVLVQRLVSQLDERIAENEGLREMLDSRQKSQSAHRSGSQEKKDKELSDSDPELHKLEELAPLELPSFDFNSFGTSEIDVANGSESEASNLKRIGFPSLQDGDEVVEGSQGK